MKEINNNNNILPHEKHIERQFNETVNYYLSKGYQTDMSYIGNGIRLKSGNDVVTIKGNPEYTYDVWAEEREYHASERTVKPVIVEKTTQEKPLDFDNDAHEWPKDPYAPEPGDDY